MANPEIPETNSGNNSEKNATQPEKRSRLAKRPDFGKFGGGNTNELGEFIEPTKEQQEKFMDRINRLSEIFEGANFTWYLDGASNISLYQDKQIREHKDLDVSIFKEDAGKLVNLIEKQGFNIFLNVEKNGQAELQPITVKELAALSKTDLGKVSIYKVDSSGNAQTETDELFNAVDLHVQDKNENGDTVTSYYGAVLPKELFKPIKKKLPNGKEVNLSQPAVVAYHKLHTIMYADDRPYDLVDLKKLEQNLGKKDLEIISEVFKKEMDQLEQKIREVSQEIYQSLSSVLAATQDQKVISEQIWLHPEVSKRREDKTTKEFVASMTEFVSKNPNVSLEAFIAQSLTSKPGKRIRLVREVLQTLEESKK